MKRTLSTLWLALATLSLLAEGQTAADEVVNIPDAALRQKIQEDLDKEGELTVGDMAKLTLLDLRPEYNTTPTLTPPSSLKGLEHAVNLRGLRLVGSWMTGDYSAPERQVIDLEGLEVLQSLRNLVWLELHDVEGVDLGLLSGMNGLVGLVLDGSSIAGDDISPIAKLPNLVDLSLAGVGDVGLEPLAGMEGLLNLNISQSPIGQRLETIQRLPDLRSLAANTTGLTDLEPLVMLKQLEYLQVADNAIASLAPLTKLPSLRSLEISKNGLRTADSLRGMSSLEFLGISLNPLQSIDFLLELPSIKDVNLNGSIYATSASREYALIDQLREKGVSIYFQPLRYRHFGLTERRHWLDSDADGQEEVRLAATPAADVVWKWNGNEAIGSEFTASLPVGETFIEIEYPLPEGYTVHDGVIVRVLESFDWEAMGIDEQGNVDTGSLLGWIAMSNRSGWVWSWKLNRMAYFDTKNISASGAWIYLPHEETIPYGLPSWPHYSVDFGYIEPTWAGFPLKENWANTHSVLQWIYILDDSDWIWTPALSKWIYLPAVKTGGVWIFSPF